MCFVIRVNVLLMSCIFPQLQEDPEKRGSRSISQRGQLPCPGYCPTLWYCSGCVLCRSWRIPAGLHSLQHLLCIKKKKIHIPVFVSARYISTVLGTSYVYHHDFSETFSKMLKKPNMPFHFEAVPLKSWFLSGKLARLWRFSPFPEISQTSINVCSINYSALIHEPMHPSPASATTVNAGERASGSMSKVITRA